MGVSSGDGASGAGLENTWPGYGPSSLPFALQCGPLVQRLPGHSAHLPSVDTSHSRGADITDRAWSTGVPSLTPHLRDTPAPLTRRSPPEAVRAITSDVTRVAGCGRESAERGFPSSSFREVAGAKYRACRMTRPPVLNSRCRRLVRDQLWMAPGKTTADARDCRGCRR